VVVLHEDRGRRGGLVEVDAGFARLDDVKLVARVALWIPTARPRSGRGCIRSVCHRFNWTMSRGKKICQSQSNAICHLAGQGRHLTQ